MITTRTGDKGNTSLLGGKRIKKASCLIKTLGRLDLLSSYLGVARNECNNVDINEELRYIQVRLSYIMSIVGVSNKDIDLDINNIEKLIEEYDNDNYYKKFYIPGSGKTSAYFDLARAQCRSTEIELWYAYENNEFKYEPALIFLNRLSDLLWILARKFGDKEDIVNDN